ncbi:arsenic resistance protein, partial [Gilvimarinus sp. 1_MG-2023]|nr:arsenical-resistance protein [Gilvimarinus sp. 1_MG-2023]
LLYVVLPLIAGALTRKKLDRGNDHQRLNSFVAALKPWSIVGLLTTVILLFGFQAETLLEKPLVIGLIAIPLLIQTYGI